MERSIAVAPDERDRQEVEETAQIPLDAVARAPVFARTVVHRELRNTVPAVMGEHRNEPMQLAVEAKALDDLGAIRLQPAVEIVQAQTRDAPSNPVEDPGERAPRDRVAPVRLPAGDEIEALVELGEQARDLGRIVLQVGVDRDHDVALGIREPSRERSRLAEVPSKPDDPDV